LLSPYWAKWWASPQAHPLLLHENAHPESEPLGVRGAPQPLTGNPRCLCGAERNEHASTRVTPPAAPMTGARFALLLVVAALLVAPAISVTSTTSPSETQGATKCAAGVEVVQAQAGTIDAPVCDDAFQASTPARERG